MTNLAARLTSQQKTTVNPISALVIDDDMADRFRLIKLCQQAGLDLDFQEAASLEEVRSTTDRGSYDIIFIDYNLGLATGQEALELVKAHYLQESAITIMVTSVDRHDVIIKAMRTGCSDYLIKEELTIEAIRKAVASAYEKKLLHAALDHERADLTSMRDAIARFKCHLAPEMRRVMSGMLWRIRSLESAPGAGRGGLHRDALESLCIELINILDDPEFKSLDSQIPPPSDADSQLRLN